MSRGLDDAEWAGSVTDLGDPLAAAAVFEHSPYLLALYEGPELRVAAANRLVRSGVDVVMVGRPLREALAEMAGQELFEVYDRVYATGRPETVHEWRLFAAQSGAVHERYFTFTLVPVRSRSGAVRGVAQYAEDVTESVLARRAAETQAAASEQRYLAAQEVVLTLQRNLLPATVPVLPGVRLAAQYVVAGAELQAGGDWFDAVAVGDGRVALVVGDVVGHGAAAAAAMAELRTVLREALRSGTPPTEAVDRLDAYAADRAATRAATVCVAVLDPADGALEHLSRAHPAPLVCGPDGATRFLDDRRAGPLGVGAGPSRSATARLAPDETVLLYSDGVVERPGEPADEGAERLARIAASAVRTQSPAVPAHVPDRLCALVVERVTRGGYVDDVTVLAAQRSAVPTAPLDRDLPAEAAALPGLREALAGWLASLGVGRDDHLALTLAAWEAASNVVDHAYAGRPAGRLRCTAEVDGRGEVRIVVADDGRWREHAASSGGRGLGLMRALTDRVDVDHTGGGTVVDLRRRPGHPTVIGTTDAPSAAVPVGGLDVVVTRRDPTVLEVRGPVDAGTTALLRTELARHGSGPLVLDLTRVTFLASAGVQLLFELTRGDGIRLVAGPDTPARQVLDLTGLTSLLYPAASPS